MLKLNLSGVVIEPTSNMVRNTIFPKKDQRADLNPYGEFELENGVWIYPVGDGNFNGDNGRTYSELTIDEFDNEGEFVDTVKFLGFVEL